MKQFYDADRPRRPGAVFEELTECWGRKYGAYRSAVGNAWEEFIPFLDYDVEIRRVICSTKRHRIAEGRCGGLFVP